MILVTGGTGVMGSRLVRKLHQSGQKIRVLTLPNDPGISRINNYIEDICYGDISKKTEIANACKGITTIYHLAAVIVARDDSMYKFINVNGTKNLIEDAKKHSVEHIIHVSSISVLYPKPTPYSLSKKAAEKIVTQSGIPFTIVRPTLVYDKQRGGLEFDLFLKYLKRFPVVPFIGKGSALKKPVYVEDIINGLSALCKSKLSFGKTYNFCGGESISMLNFSHLCLKLLGKPKKPVICLPLWFCKLLAFVSSGLFKNPPLTWPVIAGISQDANPDPSEAGRDLNYRPSKVGDMLPSCFPRDI